ncbi:pectate lyase family protein [Microbulbifer donghaiensis]|uniref:pectate lyase family protein n=1 Tax=Microbulbifer donghaiensis TaxID=494016 RepID=UPI001F4762A5|nr:pectate lyase [Microbulbifer donghaiensis]
MTALCAFSLLLSACGGGGGSGNTIPPANTATSSSGSSSSSSSSGGTSSSGSSSSGGSTSSGGSSSSSSGGSSSGGTATISEACRTLATDSNVNWRDSAELATDQEIVECLSQSLGRAVGYGEQALGGYDPDGESKLTVITKDGGKSIEQQILEAIGGDGHNWIVFDKFDFAEETEVALYRDYCDQASVQNAIGGTEAQCVDYHQWCTDNGFGAESACLTEFFNNRLNDGALPIRNPVIGTNKTIDGRFSKAYFRFNGFSIGTDSNGSDNVILTHLDFRGAGHTEDHDLDPDMIRATGGSQDIWIHKNTFDLTGDSAFDVKRGTHHLTMSFNRLMDVKRASLHGSSDDRTENADIRTTMHHNAFVTRDDLYDTFGSGGRRVPLLRRGSSHMFNNLFMNYRREVLSVRVGASVLWQDNMFLVNKDISADSLDYLQSNLVTDISGGNFRAEGSRIWMADAACDLDAADFRDINAASGVVADLAADYSQESRDKIAAERVAAGQQLADYISATAGKYGEMPFNSPLANNQAYVLDLGKVSCQ